ncbi:MAG: glycosyl hydrolase family 95 catalytic domain-containing protein [Lachnospiraceae bacterium]
MRNIKKMMGLFMTGIVFVSSIGQPGGAKAAAADKSSFQSELSAQDWESMKSVYSAPTSGGYSAMPLGNGHIGAKVKGDVNQEIIALNDKSFWSGDPKYYEDGSRGLITFANAPKTTTPQKRLEALQKTREYLTKAYQEGVSQEDRNAYMIRADSQATEMWGNHGVCATYLPIGEMRLTREETTDYTNYVRTFDMDRAMTTISYQIGDTTYTRESFASFSDDVFVTGISNDTDAVMKYKLALALPQEMQNAVYEGSTEHVADNQVTYDADRQEIVMTGRAPYDANDCTKWDADRGITFEARARIVVPEGSILTEEEGAVSIEATDIRIIYSSKTTYKDPFTDPTTTGINTSAIVKETIDRALQQTYEKCKRVHQEDFQGEFRSLWLDLNGEILNGKDYQATPEQFARHYQYTRYIMISASRNDGTDRPMQAQGMWSHTWKPMSNGAHYLNENVQKMYALVESGNLADSGDPLWKWIRNLSIRGQETAKEDFGADGWVTAHYSDIWASTALKGGTLGSTRQNEATVWTSAGLWLMNHLYDHYSYSQDIGFLEEYYDVIEGAVRFALSNLVQVDGVHGELKNYLSIMGPSNSPEVGFQVPNGTGTRQVSVDINSMSDLMIYRNLFEIVTEAAAELKSAGRGELVSEELLQEVIEKRQKLVPYEMLIDEETGAVKDFYNEYTITEPEHRHNSHLLGFYPLNYTGLNRIRTPEIYYAAQTAYDRRGSGGGHPDRTGQAIRLGNASEGLGRYNHGLYEVKSGYEQWCPIGASLVEAVIDSRNHEIDLLPNMPEEWSGGSLIGVRARGGYECNIQWAEGELTSCEILSSTGEIPVIRYKGEMIRLSDYPQIKIYQVTAAGLQQSKEARTSGAYTAESLHRLSTAQSEEEIREALYSLEPSKPCFAEQVVLNGQTEQAEGETVYQKEITGAPGVETGNLHYHVTGAPKDSEVVIDDRQHATLVIKPHNREEGTYDIAVELSDEHNITIRNFRLEVTVGTIVADKTELQALVDENPDAAAQVLQQAQTALAKEDASQYEVDAAAYAFSGETLGVKAAAWELLKEKTDKAEEYLSDTSGYTIYAVKYLEFIIESARQAYENREETGRALCYKTYYRLLDAMNELAAQTGTAQETERIELAGEVQYIPKLVEFEDNLNGYSDTSNSRYLYTSQPAYKKSEAAASGGYVVDSTKDGDIFYFGEVTMDRLGKLILHTDAGGGKSYRSTTIQVYAADAAAPVSGNRYTLSESDKIASWLVAQNADSSQNVYADSEYILSKALTGTKHLYIRLSGNGWTGNYDYLKLCYLEENYEAGDVNQDEAVDEKDIRLLLDTASGSKQMNAGQIALGDRNDDGKITAIDALLTWKLMLDTV